ncbi:pentatricopeptide repeat-containing protein At3g13150-like [Mercurialis annua]|uniref:pentatricopeptide repeat-containing protein At3g13150-like n=1 Tax=Mercurialis annua TaxID=3986 RepID=UPI0024AF77A7|nr:pentatricopeptide repeat-containing protein At3g13150-like [Mercurialis annua]
MPKDGEDKNSATGSHFTRYGMESKNVVPNVRSFNSRLRGLVLENRVADAVGLLEEMESKGVNQDVISYNAVLIGLCKDENVEEVKSWYRKLGENGYEPDRVTHVTLITFFVRRVTLTWPHVVNELVKLSRVEEVRGIVELGKSNKHSYRLSLPLDK